MVGTLTWPFTRDLGDARFAAHLAALLASVTKSSSCKRQRIRPSQRYAASCLLTWRAAGRHVARLLEPTKASPLGEATVLMPYIQIDSDKNTPRHDCEGLLLMRSLGTTQVVSRYC